MLQIKALIENDKEKITQEDLIFILQKRVKKLRMKSLNQRQNSGNLLKRTILHTVFCITWNV